MEVDLLRALVASCPDELKTRVLSWSDLAPEFKETVERWKNIASELPEEYKTRTLMKHWARQCGMVLHPDPGLVLYVPQLIGMLSGEAMEGLGIFNKLYSEGIITVGEFVNKVITYMSEHETPIIVKYVPPAYLNRHHGIEELDRLLPESPGVVILGNDRSGCKALLKAWFYRLRFQRKPEEMYRFASRFFISYTASWQPNWQEIEHGEEPQFFGLTHNIPEGVGGPAWFFGIEGEQTKLDDLAKRTIEQIRRIAELAMSHPERYRLVLTLDPNEYSALAKRFRKITSFPQINVPSNREDQLITLWLCNTPSFENDPSYSFSLAEIMTAIPEMEQDQRRLFDPEGLYDALKRSEDVLQWEDVIRKIRRGRIKKDKTRQELKTEEQREFVKKFVGSVDRLSDLVELECKLKSL